jgi:hypothetical protein
MPPLLGEGVDKEEWVSVASLLVCFLFGFVDFL